MARTKMTPEEKVAAKAAREANRKRLEQERKEKEAKESAEWNLVKREKWLEALLTLKCLQEQLYDTDGNCIIAGFMKEYGWFFEDFNVSVNSQNFELSWFETPFNNKRHYPAFTKYEYERFVHSMNESNAYFKEYAYKVEEARRKAEELANKRQQALSKLTEEEKKLLGVR